VVGEDPTVNRLEALGAEMLGKEASLLVPSGTFGNQCAIAVHTKPGDELIVSETTHVIDHEQGASGALAGVQMRAVWPANGSWPTADEIAFRIRAIPDVHHPITSLIVLENALADGTVMPLDEMRRVRELADRHGIAVHLDGARIFNAGIALGVDAWEIAALADSVMICLSKGLGAPVGSLLAGSAELVEGARRRRKMMGGGMRQAGIIAAPGIIALTEGIDQLRRDHENARLIAERIAELDGIAVDLEKTQTNMVFVRVQRPGKSEQGLVDHLNANGFASYPPLWWGIRFAISSRVDRDDCLAFAECVADYMRG
jgi:threonine aldolase